MMADRSPEQTPDASASHHALVDEHYEAASKLLREAVEGGH